MSIPFSLLTEGTLLQDGRYIVKRQIGKGGMGAVYEARATHLRKTVALKVSFDSLTLKRKKAFEREARLLANIHHSGLPRVIDYFIENNRQFLVMDFVPGKNLFEQIEKSKDPFDFRLVLDWADQLLEILDYLHTQKVPIIHRDIKPHNLKLRKQDKQDKVFLLDFGLAKGGPQASGAAASSTMIGHTPAYAPFEQVNDQGADPRSDLYSLAATLYHLLTGLLPPRAGIRVSELHFKKPDPLSTSALLSFGVPKRLADMLIKAMSIHPDDRYGSAAEMRQALKECSVDEKALESQHADAIVEIQETPAPQPPQHQPGTGLSPQSISVDLGLGGKMEFMRIPPGSFIMGSDKYDAEKPPHPVTFSQPFYVGKYEVTQALWQSVMGNNPSYFRQGGDCPVEQVSWDDTQEFIRRLNVNQPLYTFRLPTEAEWEYAARAGTTTEFAFGDDLSSDQANFDGSCPYGNAPEGKYLQRTTAVGSYSKNDFGLYDMHGNVWEWVQDWYHGSYMGAPADGSAWESDGEQKSRVLRGGSWIDNANGCRSAYRGCDTPGVRNGNIGFRLVFAAQTK